MATTMGGCIIMEGDPAPSQAKPCAEATKGYRPLFFWDLNLRYDASAVMRDARMGVGDLSNDFWELEQIHPYFYREEPKGVFTSFESILNHADFVDDDDRKPSVSFTFSGISCTGVVEKKYNAPNDTLMFYKMIPEVPIFPANALRQIIMKVKTVKTKANQVQFMWTQTINCERGLDEMNIILDPQFSYSSIFDAFRPGFVKSGCVAFREKNGCIELLENYTAQDNFPSIKQSIIEAQEYYMQDASTNKKNNLILTPILEQNVYSDGMICKKKWDIPLVAEVK